MNYSKYTPNIGFNMLKKSNDFRPQPIVVKKKEKNTMELPFGWGEGEPPTPPEEEDVKLETKQSNQ